MQINITISDKDVFYLENDLLDIQDWVEKAVIGKINQSKKRFLREWQTKLTVDSNVTSIPTDTAELINVVKARSDYKNRTQRETTV